MARRAAAILAAVIAAAPPGSMRTASAQDAPIPARPEVTDGSASPKPAEGEYSLRGATREMLHPQQPDEGAATETPATWIPMKLLYTDQPVPGSEEVVAAWKRTKTELLKGAAGSAVLYQIYQTNDTKAVVVIGLSPRCAPKNGNTPKGSKVMICPAQVYVTSVRHPARIIEQREGCFQWNGQSPPDSPTDPRLNSDYTLWEPARLRVTIEAIVAGTPVPRCEVVFDLKPPPSAEEDE